MTRLLALAGLWMGCETPSMEEEISSPRPCISEIVVSDETPVEDQSLYGSSIAQSVKQHALTTRQNLGLVCTQGEDGEELKITLEMPRDFWSKNEIDADASSRIQFSASPHCESSLGDQFADYEPETFKNTVYHQLQVVMDCIADERVGSSEITAQL